MSMCKVLLSPVVIIEMVCSLKALHGDRSRRGIATMIFRHKKEVVKAGYAAAISADWTVPC